MLVKTNLTLNDLYKFYVLPFYLSRGFYISTVFIFLWIIGMNYKLLLEKIANNESILSDMGEYAFSAVISMLFIGLIINLTKAIKQSKMPNFLGTHEMKITDEFFIETSGEIEMKSPWKKIKTLTKHSYYISVFLDKDHFHVIGKNAFESDEAYENYFKELKRRVDEN